MKKIVADIELMQPKYKKVEAEHKALKDELILFGEDAKQQHADFNVFT